MIGTIDEAKSTRPRSAAHASAAGLEPEFLLPLRSLLPFKVFADVHANRRDDSGGLFRSPAAAARLRCGTLARHLLSYSTSDARAKFILAIDEGVMVKTGAEVRRLRTPRDRRSRPGPPASSRRAGVSEARASSEKSSAHDTCEVGERAAAADSPSFNVPERDSTRSSATDTELYPRRRRTGDAQAASAPRRGARCVVRLGHAWTYRLVGCDANPARGAGSVCGSTSGTRAHMPGRWHCSSAACASGAQMHGTGWRRKSRMPFSAGEENDE